MNSRSEPIATAAPEAPSPPGLHRLKQYPPNELSQKRKRLDEIGRRPHSGKLARKLRQRKGMSIEDVGSCLGVDPDVVSLFEQCGDVRIWTDFPALEPCSDDHGAGEELLEAFIELLEADPEEQEILRHDLCEDLTWMVDLLEKILPQDLWGQLGEDPPVDPWDEETSQRPKRRARSKVPPLSALAAFGTRSLPPGTTSEETAAIDKRGAPSRLPSSSHWSIPSWRRGSARNSRCSGPRTVLTYYSSSEPGCSSGAPPDLQPMVSETSPGHRGSPERRALREGCVKPRNGPRICMLSNE